MAREKCCKDVVPFWAIIAMNFTTVGLRTLFKAATNNGMSYHVFMVYEYGVAALLLLPSPFFSLRSRVLPPLSFSLSCKIFLLAVIGCANQTLGYAGISHSSPALDSAISSLTPAFTFILALIFRMEKLAIRSSSSQAKIIGTIVSISGALVVTLYKGPPILSTPPPSISLHYPLLRSLQSDWVIGAFLLTLAYILLPIWSIVMTQIVTEYPAELTIVFFYNLWVSILSAILGVFTEPSASAWRIKADMGMLSILCSGIFGSLSGNVVNSWALKVKGPVYVAMFKPLSIVIAVVMGVVLLGDILYLGSIIGAAIISIGFYSVMWGKEKEDVDESPGEIGDPESGSQPKAPLLESYLAQEQQSLYIS